MSKPLAKVTVALACLLVFTPLVHAHALFLKAEKRQGKLYVEAWFDDDTPAQGATVKITQDGRLVGQGKTDERGVWTAECPPSGRYDIEATDGGGHRTHVIFTILESSSPQHAGTSHEAVAERRTTGLMVGLAAVAMLMIAGRWWLRRSRSTPPPVGS